MKLSRKIAFGLLVLSLALQFAGCSSISNLLGTSGESETTKNDNKQLEQQQRNKQKQINDLKADLELNQQKAKDERKKCEDMTKDTVKAGKNPENQKDSPQTFAQCQKASSIEDQVKIVRENQSKNEEELREIDKKISSIPTVEVKSDDGFNWLSFLLLGLAGLAGLAVVGGIYYVLNKKIEERIRNERHSRQRDIDSVRSEQREFSPKIKDLDKTAKVQSDQLTQIQMTIQSLQRQVAESGGKQHFQPQAFHEPPVYKPESKFPISAEDYINKVSSSSQTATADLIGGRLVHDTDKGNEFLIVKDNDLTNGFLYAVPNMMRFSKAGDYLTYYQNYYDCDSPSGGTVLINRPTIVQPVDGGWKLVGKGELEVR